MQENIILDNLTDENGYQVIVTGITWSKEIIGKYRSKKDFSENLPEQITFVIPQNIVNKENTPIFNDLIETFVYNLLAKRFNHIAYHCQIWLPLKAA